MLLFAAIVSLLNPAYESEGFSYSIPRTTIESFIDGKAYDHKESYSSEERSALEQDTLAIYASILDKDPLKGSSFVVTAGPPGSGKTTVLKQHLARASILAGKKIAYMDPDDVCLKQMKHSYQKEMGAATRNLDPKTKDYLKISNRVKLDLYNKWRPGSNAASHLILANLIRDNYTVYFGTTLTSPTVEPLFDLLKKRGYSIKILYVAAPDDVRWGSVQTRERDFVQSTEEDVREKGKLVAQKLRDTYLKYADEIEFYYRKGVHDDALLTAVWKKDGTLNIVDPCAYAQVQKIHNLCCDKMDRPDLFWPDALKEKKTAI